MVLKPLDFDRRGYEKTQLAEFLCIDSVPGKCDAKTENDRQNLVSSRHRVGQHQAEATCKGVCNSLHYLGYFGLVPLAITLKSIAGMLVRYKRPFKEFGL
jgi:hypothetical protein